VLVAFVLTRDAKPFQSVIIREFSEEKRYDLSPEDGQNI
jgi:hypothetical protein